MKLPESWLEMSLGQVLNRVDAKIAPQSSKGSSHFYIGLEHIESHTGRLLRDVEEVSKDGDILSIKTAFRMGDILYGKLRPNLNKVYLAEQDGICSTDIWAFRPSSEILPEFALHYLRSPAVCIRASQLAAGANLPRASANSFDRIPIPLPTLPEQQRIINVLKQAETIINLGKQTEDFISRLHRQLFIEIFGDPVENPKQIRKVPISKLFKVKSGEFLPARSMANDGIFKVYGGNGVNGVHDHYMFEEQKVIIGRVGAYCGAIHYSEPKAWITDNALYVSEKLTYLNDHYLCAALQFANLNQYAGQAGQPLISASRINPVKILLPEKNEQDRYASIVRSFQIMGEFRQIFVQQFNQFRNELLQQSYSGELTKNWRNQNFTEIVKAAKQRKEALTERGTKPSIRIETQAPPERPTDFSRPARRWLIDELSELQQEVWSMLRDEWKGSVIVDDPAIFADFCTNPQPANRMAHGAFPGIAQPHPPHLGAVGGLGANCQNQPAENQCPVPASRISHRLPPLVRGGKHPAGRRGFVAPRVAMK